MIKFKRSIKSEGVEAVIPSYFNKPTIAADDNTSELIQNMDQYYNQFMIVIIFDQLIDELIKKHDDKTPTEGIEQLVLSIINDDKDNIDYHLTEFIKSRWSEMFPEVPFDLKLLQYVKNSITYGSRYRVDLLMGSADPYP